MNVAIKHDDIDRLKALSQWLGEASAKGAFEKIVSKKMMMLDIKAIPVVPETKCHLIKSVEEAPSDIQKELRPTTNMDELEFTKTDRIQVGEAEIDAPEWNKIFGALMQTMKHRGLSQLDMLQDFSVKAAVGKKEGCLFYPDANISIEIGSIDEVWAEIDRLSTRWGISVIVDYSHISGSGKTGKTGTLYSGMCRLGGVQ